MSSVWYRNSDWNAAIESEFEERIARSRSQKAQYLMLQGQALVERHPEVAVRLLERSIAQGDDFFLNQANCHLAAAQMALGNPEAALAAYEAALEAQLRMPNIQTSAPLDYAFLVAWTRSADRYPGALAMLDAVSVSFIPSADFQADAAHALILAELGQIDRASERAAKALAEFPDEADDAEWGGIHLGELRSRLSKIAS